MVDTRPEVTVVIPVYNRVGLLRRAVRSVLGQTVDDLEVLVVDDASDEDVSKVLATVADLRLRVVRRVTNGGGAAARNTGVEEARGRYIAFLDSDDEWLPRKLERQLPTLSGRTAGLSLCSFCVRTSYGVRSGLPGALRGEAAERLLALTGGPLTASVFVLPRRVFDDGVRFDEGFPALQDLDLAYQVLRGGWCVTGTKESLVRKYADHGLGSVFNRDSEIPARSLLLRKYVEELEARPRSKARHHTGLALAHAERGETEAAMQELAAAGACDPRWRTRVLAQVLPAGPGVFRQYYRAWRFVEDADWDLVRRRAAEIARDATRHAKHLTRSA